MLYYTGVSRVSAKIIADQINNVKTGSVDATEHGYKYSSVYVVDGIRVLGFDNECGKGDQCHLDGVEVLSSRA